MLLYDINANCHDFNNDNDASADEALWAGSVDVLIALTGASGGALSGMVVAHSSYTILSLAGGLLSLLLIPVIIWSRSKHNSV